jgi:precorrin-3B C17-methyltransferase
MKKITVVGIGPGSINGMTAEAHTALSAAELIAGYTAYIDLVAPFFPGTPVYRTGMMQETERCRFALEQAASGITVALVCSGDSGVYGMSSLVYELSHLFPAVDIEIISGVTAALSGAAVLGSPLTNDFAVISLSNLLTPQNVIERRLRAAAAGDFCIALYNPASHRRPDTLRHACRILEEILAPATPGGWVRNIGRDGCSSSICTLDELSRAELDMFCTAFIGNSMTKVIATRQGERLVTCRGYRIPS